MQPFTVFIMTNFNRTVIYTGLTSDLARQIEEFKLGAGTIFTSKYKVRFLLYFEEYPDVITAHARMRQITGWRREKKIALIRQFNPDFKFLQYHREKIPPSSESH